MTIADLQARAFVEHRTLPKPFTYCLSCGVYRWFDWWQVPDRRGFVAACATCGTVPASDEQHVSRHPIVRKVEAA